LKLNRVREVVKVHVRAKYHQAVSATLHMSYRAHREQESPANAKGTRDSSACMKAHCKQM